MSFLGGRLAATEGAFFSQTSKQALARLRDKLNSTTNNPSTPPSSSSASAPALGPSPSRDEATADVLPEILQHSPVVCRGSSSSSPSSPLPSAYSPPPSSLAASLISAESQSSVVRQRPRVDHGLTFFAGVPQTSFGPRRWKPESSELKVMASTANEARMEDGPQMDAARAQALIQGYSVVFKAFLVATTIVVGGAAGFITYTFSRLQIRSLDDIRVKGHSHMQSQAEAIQQGVEPWKQWVEQLRQRWKINDDNRYRTLGGIFAKSLGVKKHSEQPKLEVEGGR